MTEFKTFISFLEKRRDIYELFDSLDIFNTSMSSRKLKSGMTFLVPNSNYIAKIKSMADQSDESAIEQIHNLFLTVYLPNSNEWSRHKSDIPNLHNRKLEIDTISRDSIKLKNGTQLTNLNFNSGKEPVALYSVSGGVVPKGTSPSSKKITKGTSTPQVLNKDIRKVIYASLLTSTNIYNSCGNYVGSFIKWLSKYDEVLYDGLIPLLDYCPITSFMIVFEPNKGGHYLLDDEIIDKWYNNHSTNNGLVYLNKALSTKVVCNAHTAGFIDVVDELRIEICDCKLPSQVLRTISNIYDSLVFDNCVGSIKTVLPQTTNMLLKKASQKGYNIKLFQDELRLYISALLSEEMSTYKFLDNISSSMKLLPILNDSSTCNSMSKSEYIARVATFVNTTYFLYLTPNKEGEYGGVACEYEDINPDSEQIADLIPAKIKKLQSNMKITNRADVIDNFEELIANGGEGITRELYNKIKAIMENQE